MKCTLFSFRFASFTAALALASLTGGCRKDKSTDPKDACVVPATIEDLGILDGCGKILVLADGQKLSPTGDAWTKFASSDGQRVVIDYAPTNEMSVCMNEGPTVQVKCIRLAD